MRLLYLDSGQSNTGAVYIRLDPDQHKTAKLRLLDTLSWSELAPNWV